MGNLIRFRPPEAEATWDSALVYRSDTGVSGTYNLLATQAISDNTYFDEAGDSTSYYKVRFKTDEGVFSGYSEAFLAGSTQGYCSIEDIRRVSGLTSTQVSDLDVYGHLDAAIAQLNSDINVEISEQVKYIDGERKNTIDGSNTVFYVRQPWLGDLNNDGEVTTADLDVWKLDTSNVRTALTVSSINDDKIGKFTLSSAPSSGDRLYVRYMRAPLDEETPHMLIRMACATLAGAWAFTGIEAKKIQSHRVGKIEIKRQSEGFEKLYGVYEMLLGKINSDIAATAEFPSTMKDLSELVWNGGFKY